MPRHARPTALWCAVGAALAAAGAPLPTGAQAVAVAAPAADAIQGIVRDRARAPLADVQVRLLVGGQPAAEVRTGADGRFTLHPEAARPAAAGMTRWLAVRRAGYADLDVELRPGEPAAGDSLVVILRAAGDTAGADADSASLGSDRLAGFLERRAARRGGRFLDEAVFERLRGQRPSDALRQVPGVRVLPMPSGAGNMVRVRGCRPMVWLQGVPMAGQELDQVIGVGDITAMEIYISPAEVPAQYRDTRQNCGALLVWTH